VNTKKNKIFAFTLCHVIIFSTPSMANETSTSLTGIETGVCANQIMGKNRTDAIIKLQDILKSERTNKLSKKDSARLSKMVNSFTKLLRFDCGSISQEFWDDIKFSREESWQKAFKELDEFHKRLVPFKPVSIVCYKDGVLETISGKSPKCPKGYKKVS